MELISGQNSMLTQLLRHAFEKFYQVDLASSTCTELTLDAASPTAPVDYEEWLVQFARKMYKTDSVPFFEQMNLRTICAKLEQSNTDYMVYYRLSKGEYIGEFSFQCFFADEEKSALIFAQKTFSPDLPRPLETFDRLSVAEDRFCFLVDHILEDFIEVRVSTGECHMFHRNNGMVSRHTLKEQIAWWAENIIVPEERAAYIAEFELDNLIRLLRMQNGYHTSTYTVLRNGCRCSFSIVSTLRKMRSGTSEEYIFAYAQDITVLREQEERNKQLVDISQQLLTISQTETVTGLYNRAAAEKFIEEHLQNSASGGAGTLLLMDVDHFKLFNDQYGHTTGDFVLQYLGKCMQDVFRSDDILCRWGGDEFIVFMRDVCQKKNVESRIERLRMRMKQCHENKRKIPVTLSIGAAVASRGDTLKSLFTRCDAILYQVKKDGRNGYQIDEGKA